MNTAPRGDSGYGHLIQVVGGHGAPNIENALACSTRVFDGSSLFKTLPRRSRGRLHIPFILGIAEAARCFSPARRRGEATCDKPRGRVCCSTGIKGGHLL